MALDEGLAQIVRDDLQGLGTIERKMFGGLAFLLGGHMVCAVSSQGAMFRVGKDSVADALAVRGARRVKMGKRTMAGWVGCDDETCADDTRRGHLMALALATVAALPPKT